MLIQQKEAGNHGKFFIEKDCKELAEITYTLSENNVLTIDHTEVGDELRGQKVGYVLVQHVVDHAREKNLKIIPMCPFAYAVFKKKAAEYKDVLKA